MQQFLKKWQDKTQLVDDKSNEWDEWVCFFTVNYGFLNMLYRVGLSLWCLSEEYFLSILLCEEGKIIRSRLALVLPNSSLFNREVVFL